MPEVRMPKMGDGMDEGTILRWLKHEGDSVAAEEPIAEIETDKANVEMPAEDAGTLTRIVVREGETVPVGAVIGYIGEPGEAAAPVKSPGRNETGAAAAPALDGSPAPAPAAAPVTQAGVGQAAGSAARVKASPLARRMARELGIDLTYVRGTGAGAGRIVARDVLAAKEKAGAPVPAPTAAAPQTIVPKPAAEPAPAGAEDREVSRMRKAIARRTVHSKQTSPHFYLTMPITMDRAMSLLADIAEASPDDKVTVNDLIVKACAVALTRMPDVNASFTPDEKLRVYGAVNIGVAVGTDNGLTIPVITDCGAKTLRQIAADTKALVAKARSGSLVPQEMSGGTFTVSNLGMFGIEEFAAIINPPEAAILAVGAVAPEVLVADDGSFVARKRMRVTLSCDHRAVDGLLGARFLQVVRELLEQPLALLA